MLLSIFYRGPRALITDEFFEVAGSRRYPVCALRDVHIVRYQPTGEGLHQAMGLSAMAAAVVAIPLVGRESAILGALIVVVLLAQAAFSLSRRPPPRWDLVAVCDREYAVLFSSSDQREFEQVCRGLQRSLERLAEGAG
ncbi:hypothetical protein FB565_003759 [Actinoplanes lutulentus]|uniref:Uncharacterized protein n=1 Tax=Actinoplanes lutulentus TaxID=1287878 RepID=A0A327ZIG1_9ACTN|nr:DUF6232 family protein [Actinoplanes lutulentus]MBB2944030.1 hypothetical protein [Actinoplanes lutulentus]RAK42737.1 hypothetical protein B0I29_102563 [Actinoplanes lutulentus]